MAMYPNMMHSIPFIKHKSKMSATSSEKAQKNNEKDEKKAEEKKKWK